MADISKSQRLLSYLMEIPLETISSPIHPSLQVSLQQGRLQLSTDKAIYSFSDLYTNFRRAFQQLRLEEIRSTEALLLGLGLGSIPEMLEKKFNKHFHYTAVELDEAVIYLAQKYTLSELKAPFDIYCSDAGDYVKSCPDARFGFICVDLFIDDEIPSKFTQPGFFADLHRLLQPDGLLLFNCFSLELSDRRKAQNVFQDVFLPQFPEATYLDTGTNWILVSRKNSLR